MIRSCFWGYGEIANNKKEQYTEKLNMKSILGLPERDAVVIPYHPAFIQQAVNESFRHTGLQWEQNGTEMHTYPELYIGKSLRDSITTSETQMLGRGITITGLRYIEAFGEEGAANFKDELAYLAGGPKEKSRAVKNIADQILFKIGLLEEGSLESISGMTELYLSYAQQAYKRFSHSAYDVFDMMSRFTVPYTRALRFLKTEILQNQDYINYLLSYCEEEDAMLGKVSDSTPRRKELLS